MMKRFLFLTLICVLTLTMLIGCSCAENPSADADTIEAVRRVLQQDIAYTPSTIDALRERYPRYFDLPTDKGVEVYTWKTEETVYYGVLAGTNRNKTKEELESLKANGATLGEMQVILSSYDLPQDKISVLSLDIFLKHTN